MDSTYTYASPGQVMGPDTFGDDEDFSAYDPSLLLGTFPNEGMPFLDETNAFAMPLDLQATTLGTPPLDGFDGYLAGNLDFDESLFDAGDLLWGADMYNQSFSAATPPGMDGFNIPPPPSTASESQGFSPGENVYLPFTPPELAAFSPQEVSSFTPSNVPSPSSASASASGSTTTLKSSTDRKPSSSTGPKRQLRKIVKPETCPVCGKGHAQLRERDRHIITQHYDEAVRMGLNVDRPQCGLCDQSFRRKDHLTRHMKRRHGH